ncbi:hypothetical protein MXD59_10060 [Frankia sp. Ag45/Mut15]|uniref:Integral membrane protein n=1 Tax=Frankia umida TaxID=573489 RepID=A0ABT0JY21_9ACTN|nr:hypothetical protein [Frankia umida]MCK9876117.1 hypothetical protein [Frankia umida]
MVTLRSRRQDRLLVVVVWLLTVVVLGLGIATVNPILLLWGVIGLPGAVFLTRVHLRDTRGGGGPSGSSDPDGPSGTDVSSDQTLEENDR